MLTQIWGKRRVVHKLRLPSARGSENTIALRLIASTTFGHRSRIYASVHHSANKSASTTAAIMGFASPINLGGVAFVYVFPGVASFASHQRTGFCDSPKRYTNRPVDAQGGTHCKESDSFMFINISFHHEKLNMGKSHTC